MNNNDKSVSKETEELLNDDDIREWFRSRDPDRKKTNPFLTDDAEKQYTGRASKLAIINKDDKEQIWGISYSEHQKHLKQSSKNFMWVGINIGLFLSILSVVIFKTII